MKTPRSFFGAALVAVRTSLDISQYRLAKDSGLSEKYLNLLEHGAYDPQVSTVLKISRALGVSAGVLLDEQERIEVANSICEEQDVEATGSLNPSKE